MGFTRKRKVYELDFEGTDYEGLKVKLSGLTTGEYLDFVVLSASASAEGSDGNKETQGMIEMFSRHLLSWNLEDEDGEAVPADLEGLKANDLSMNLVLVDAWIGAISGVSEAVGKKSSDGANPLVESIPMEAL